MSIGINDSRCSTSDVGRFLVDTATMGFHLDRGKKRFPMWHGCHLMPYADAVTEVSLDNSGKGSNSNSSNTVVVNAMQINTVFSPANEAHFGTGNATVRTAVDKCAWSVSGSRGRTLIEDVTTALVNRVYVVSIRTVVGTTVSNGRVMMGFMVVTRPACP